MKKQRVEFGDFQTPDVLARNVCEVLRNLDISPETVLEPTCGKGSFLRASTEFFSSCSNVFGYEIRPEYVEEAKSVDGATVRCQDFFQMDWPGLFRQLQEPILVIGNPPWVTNSAMGAVGGTNLPAKSNFRGFSGLEAMMGKSNFDISEWMLIHFLECLSGREAILAMLCKTGVARKVLQYAWERDLEIGESRIYTIDATKHFRAAVDACLLICILKPEVRTKECATYANLGISEKQQSSFAFREGRLIADLESYDLHNHLLGESSLKWRSGVKHDCSKVMELRRTEFGSMKNGLGEVVNLETTNLYPMLKGSDLIKAHPTPSRHMLITQRTVGEDTSRLQKESPLTWEYLLTHRKRLDSRRSAIYRNRPRFSIFGIGAYSFAPWKVAIAGFSKRLNFHCVGPYNRKPVVVDDTCYFLPCETRKDAEMFARLLNSATAQRFFQSFIFWDAKRPVTAQLLTLIDFKKLAEDVGIESNSEWASLDESAIGPLFGTARDLTGS